MTKTVKAAKLAIRVMLYLCLSAVLLLPFYILMLFEGRYWLPPAAVGLLTVLLAAVFFLIKGLDAKKAALISGLVCILWFVLVFAAGKAEKKFIDNERYLSPPDTKAELFSDKKVMLLVPHQDDEINLLGGVIEEYARFGSELTVVYSTNGDYYGNGAVRLEEAAQVLSVLGVDEENIVFLGYGDEWRDGHIYNSPGDEQKISHAGFSETYGSGNFRPYREGRAYTNNNFRQDLKELILEYRPEVIFCVDYDYNRDHRALSLMFEKVMGEILRQDGDYRPVVMKGFAYSTAWYSLWDYEQDVNLGSTVNVHATEYMAENNIYLWQDRVRLPVSAASLSRTLEAGRLYDALSRHRSQNAAEQANGVINSDKVFWHRDTGSILYDAYISVSSGAGELLNDFMLTESSDIEKDIPPFEGTWRPEADDPEPCIKVSFSGKKDIYRLAFYDDPSMVNNILRLRVRFDDGTELSCGPLLKNGSASELFVGKQRIGSMEIYIEEYEGDRPGLTEIEAYGGPYVPPFSLIKLTDRHDNFVYDYLTWEQELSLSLWSSLPYKPEMADMELALEGEGSASLEDGTVKISLNEGGQCTVTIRHTPSGLSDSVIVRSASTEKENALGRHIFERRQDLLDWQRDSFGMVMNDGLIKCLLYPALYHGRFTA